MSLLLVALLATPVCVHGQGEAVRLGGELRVRSEADRPAGMDSVSALSLLRSRIGVEAQLSTRSFVYMQIQDARTFGEEVSTADGAADRLDLHQAYLQYGFNTSEHALSIRAGRQELAFGNERLVGAVNWSNTGRAFDAARVTFGSPQSNWQLTGVAATVQERGRRYTGTESTTADHLFVAAYFETRRLDLFALHDREDAYRTAAGVDRTTLGARVSAPPMAGWTASLEGAYQLGNQLWDAAAPQPIDQDIRAYLVGARLAYAPAFETISHIGIGLDVLSGDDDRADERYRAFHTLYATNHKYYGYMDLFSDPAARTHDGGLVDGMASATLGLARELSLAVDAHGFWLQQELGGATDRFIGWELDLTLPVKLGEGQRLQLGYSAFRNGAAAQVIGFGNTSKVAHWAHIQATFSFGGRTAPLL